MQLSLKIKQKRIHAASSIREAPRHGVSNRSVEPKVLEADHLLRSVGVANIIFPDATYSKTYLVPLHSSDPLASESTTHVYV